MQFHDWLFLSSAPLLVTVTSAEQAMHAAFIPIPVVKQSSSVTLDVSNISVNVTSAKPPIFHRTLPVMLHNYFLLNMIHFGLFPLF